MKKLTLFFSFGMLSIGIFAQNNTSVPLNYQYGTGFIGGYSNFGLSTTKEDESGNKSFNFSTKLTPGVFFHDNWAAGLLVDYNHFKYTNKFNNQDYTNTFSEYAIGPWARKYFQVNGLAGSPYGMVDFGFGRDKYSGDSYPEDQIDKTTFYHLGIGWALELCCDCVELDLGLSYAYHRSVNSDNSSQHSTTTGIQFEAGLDVHFPVFRNRLERR